MMSGSGMIDSALAYADRGWQLFPLQRDTKGRFPDGRSSQLLPSGFLNASSNVDVIQRWWRRWPDANIGLSLAASGLVAIDADLYKQGCGWEAYLRDRAIPRTFTQESARGGRHFVFRTVENDRFRGSLCAGVDIKHRGYILLAPSTFEGAPYRLLDDCDPELRPDWLTASSRSPVIDTGLQDLPGRAGRDEVEELLSWIDPDAAGYDAWVEVLQALHAHFERSPLGLEIADSWSRRGPAYQEGDVTGRWPGFAVTGGVTIGSIAHQARQNGADLSEISRKYRKQGASIRTKDPRPQDVWLNTTAQTTDLSHDALALLLGRAGFDRDAKYVASQERWYFWTGQQWQADEHLRSLTRTRQFLRELAGTLRAAAGNPISGTTERKIGQLKSHATIAAVASLARGNPHSVATADTFDSKDYLLGTPGGTVDLRVGKLRDARRTDLITRLTSIGPAEPGAIPALWLKFLDEIMEGDTEVIGFLRRAAGYALTGATNEHKLLFLHGSGRNGKSVFLNTLLKIWGDHGRRVAATTFLSSRTEHHPTDIAGLRGVRLAVASELPRGKTWDEAIIKDLTGGDRLTARFMRQDFFEFDPKLTLMIAGNVQPSFRGIDMAIRSRVVLVPFAVTIPPERQDRDLENKLQGEAPEILRWCIDGAIEWQKRGLDVPDVLARASEEYFDAEDVIGQFLQDRTRPDPEAFASGADIGLQFNHWAALQGLTPWSQRTVIKELKSRGYPEARQSSARGLKGLRLT